MFLRILLLIVGVSSGIAGKIKQYECGEHGRFEYCVDGVPGCVVGCHCHPGYYFDTETKICEPNAKLVQDYRRHYLSEPTRVRIPITPAYEIEVTPTLSTKTPLDNQMDQALAKDTDDIGDWLYNQFFKTIENQVLSANNNTDNSNTNANNQTRRTGTGVSQKKEKRKKVMPKKIKFSKISKKDDLRRKLLRITEDDSLFDSDSRSRSRSRSTEDSKSSSNSDSSDTSLETDDDCNGDDSKNKNKNGKCHKNDKEHGHRKILVVKKKPKPPLPSFIFLPNLETPFFPPIGLPPPPPMPMYPMVPVPPMPLPPFPFTMIIPTQSDDKTKAPKKTTHSPKHTTQKPHEETPAPEHSTEKAVTEVAEDKTEKPDQTATEKTEKLSLRNRMLKRKKLLRQFRDKHPGPFIPFDHRKAMPPINPLMPSVNDYMDIADMMDDMTRPPPPLPPPGPPPVDFKYLSQLIHKLNPNISNAEVKNKIAVPQRRFETQYNHHDPDVAVEPLPPATDKPPLNAKLPDGDENYYANLGQQIASLIRRLDSAGPQPTPKTTHDGVINGDNNFASRSYWERSVRSLFSHYPPNSNDINFLRNEENLLNLENKVKVVATTQRSWNLHELENVIFLADRIKSRIHDMKMKNIQDSHKENLRKLTKVNEIQPLKSLKLSEAENLNINLLPQQTDILDRKESSPIPGRRNIPQTHITNETKNKTFNPLEEFINKQNIHYNLRGILMQNFKNIFQKSDNQKQSLKHATYNGTNVNQKSITKPGTSLRKFVRMDQMQSELQNKPLRPKVKPRAKPRSKHEGSNEQFLSNVKVLPKPSADIQQHNPMLSNYKNTPLRSSHHNKYIFENDALAFQLAPAPTQQERAYYQVPHHHNYFD